MDCRDIKEMPNDVGVLILEEIYSLQKQLLDHYISIENIDSYPINVNTKKAQVLLKDFTGRVIEELAEGYESHLMVRDIVESVNGNVSILSQKEYNQMLAHLQNLNEEQADAMHFMIELLIYANIQPDDIRRWVIQKAEQMGYHFDSDDSNIIALCMELGYEQSKDDYDCTYMRYHTYLPFDEESDPNILQYIPGGREYNKEEISINRKSLWDITYALNLSRNCLKNKPWKQSGVMTNESLYQSKLVEAFVYLMGYYARLGISPDDLYFLYFKKNRVNLFRIKSKY